MQNQAKKYIYLISVCAFLYLYPMNNNQNPSCIPKPGLFDKFFGNWDHQLNTILNNHHLSEQDKKSPRIQKLLSHVLIKALYNRNFNQFTGILTSCTALSIPIETKTKETIIEKYDTIKKPTPLGNLSYYGSTNFSDNERSNIEELITKLRDYTI